MVVFWSQQYNYSIVLGKCPAQTSNIEGGQLAGCTEEVLEWFVADVKLPARGNQN